MEDTIIQEINIRPMRERDIPEIGNIERLCFPSPWTSQLFALELKREGFAYYWIIELKDKVVGYAGYWKIQDEAHIVTFAIHPLYRGRGLGKILLDYILKDIQNRGIKKVTLEVRESNKVAQRLYEKFGFKKIAIRPRYYQDKNEDAFIYWKIL